MAQEFTSLKELLDVIEEAAKNKESVSLDAILEVVGRRSFGPLLLVAGLVTVAPVIGDIPGVPLLMGSFVLVTAVQLLLSREHLWLPQWILRRSVSRQKLCRAVELLRSPARFLDRLSRQRLTALAGKKGFRVIAAACIVIALTMPAMEVIPFSANLAGIALTAFGLALIAHDGLVALIALLFTSATFGVVVYTLV